MVTEILDECYCVGTYPKLGEQSVEWTEHGAIITPLLLLLLLLHGLLFIANSYTKTLKHDSSFVKFLHNDCVCYGKWNISLN